MLNSERELPLTSVVKNDIFPIDILNRKLLFCRRGETGRRTGLKIPRGRPHDGSIPSAGTTCKGALFLLLKGKYRTFFVRLFSADFFQCARQCARQRLKIIFLMPGCLLQIGLTHYVITVENRPGFMA